MWPCQQLSIVQSGYHLQKDCEKQWRKHYYITARSLVSLVQFSYVALYETNCQASHKAKSVRGSRRGVLRYSQQCRQRRPIAVGPDYHMIRYRKIRSCDLNRQPIALKFNRFIAIIRIRVRTKFHQAKCSGLRVIVVTKKRTNKQKLSYRGQ